MREKFIPKKDELLRKAWKTEWDNLSEPKPTWEEFKRKKQFTGFVPKENDWLRGPWEDKNAWQAIQFLLYY